MVAENTNASFINNVRVSQTDPTNGQILSYSSLTGEYELIDKNTMFPYDEITDPALNAATTTAKIDAYDGTIITLTTTGSNQTLSAPTLTTGGRHFTVVNNDTSTDSIDIIDGVGTITVQPGEAQKYIWDGTVWVVITAIDAEDIAFTPAGNIVATNVQAAIEEVDTEKLALAGGTMTGDILGSVSLGATGTRLTKGWFTDLEVTNAIAGSITGNAATVSTISGLAPDTATTQAAQPNITSATNLVTVGTIGTGTWQGTAVGDTYISSAATWNAKEDALTFTAADFNRTGDTVSIDYTNSQAASAGAKGFLTSTDWSTFNGKQDALTFGIANTNAVDIDSAGVIDNDYAKFTANGLEGRSYSEVKTDLSLNNVENTALTTWAGSSNITTTGALNSGSISSGFGSIDVGASAIDGGVITADTNFAGALTGNVTGNCSGSAGTVATITGLAPDTATTQAAQPSITSVGTLTSLAVTGGITAGEDSTINDITIGRGAGNISSNTASGNQALAANTTGNSNTANGFQSLFYNTTGGSNTADGRNALFYNTTGNYNTGNGFQSLYYNTTGNSNTASGYASGRYAGSSITSNTTSSYSIYVGKDSRALADGQTNQIVIGASTASVKCVGHGSNTATIGNSEITDTYLSGDLTVTGGITAGGDSTINDITIGRGGGDISSNTANGYLSLFYNTTGGGNTASGYQSLYSNETGNSNTANGFQSLFYNTTGGSNTADGRNTLYSNTTGNYNTASGQQSLYNNTEGGSNTADGYDALYNNTTGNSNTANGRNALYSNETGNYNTASGYLSLYNNTTGNSNTANGHASGRYVGTSTTANTTSSYSVFVGKDSRPLDDGQTNQIVIGASTASVKCVGNGSNTVTIGNSEITDNYLNGDLAVTGRVTEAGTFAEIHVADASTAQSIATGATYTKITAFTDNGFSSNCTADVANDKITFTKTGIYRVDGQASMDSGTNNVTFKVAAFLNGVEQDQVHFQRKMSVASDIGSGSFTGFIDVTTVGWDLDMRARHDNGGSVNLTIEYGNLNVSYVGET